MEAGTAPDHTEVPPERAGIWEDFIDIFFSPREVFARRREGVFVAAMIALTVLLAILTIPTQMSMSGAVEAAMQEAMQNSAGSGISQEQIERVGQFSVFMSAIGMLFATPFGILLTGAVLWGASRLVGIGLAIAPAFMIATYASFPKILALVFTMIQGALIDPTAVNEVSLGPARFLGEGTDPVLMGLLLRLDVFTIWGTALLALGVATVGRTSNARGWTVAAIVWVAAALAAVIIALAAASRG